MDKKLKACYNYLFNSNNNKMTLPVTTTDVRFGRNVVEYDANWRPKRQPDWFDNICNKIKSILKRKGDTPEQSNIDRV